MQNFELENLNKYINWLIDQVEGRLKFRKPSWWEKFLGEKERKEMKTEILDVLLG
jgi:predicted acetyltransferase